MMDTLHRMLEHLRWADLRSLEALRRAERPPASALEIYAHVLGSEHVWLARLRQEPATLAVWPVLEVESCARVAEENARGLHGFLASLNPDELSAEVTYTNSAGQDFRSTIRDILVHVALHGSYHRGQVALLLRQDGVEPEPTDYIAFVRGAPAATRVR